MRPIGIGSTRLWQVLYVNNLLFFSVALSSCGPSVFAASVPANIPITAKSGSVTIKITNSEVKGAIAHVVETHETVTLDRNTLVVSACSPGQHISVWAPGYYIYTFECSGISPIEYPVSLEAVDSTDNPNYTWMDADIRTDPTRNCASCHSGQSLDSAEYLEWNKDGHSKAFVDPFFWTMYLGTDVNRNASPQTQWGTLGNGQRIRSIPDPTLPDYGPGYHLDYPNDNGNCIYCHVPAGSPGTPQEMNLTSLINSSPGTHVNVATEGVTCDVCHKVTDVLVGEDQLPHDDHPGVMSMSIVQPASSPLVVFGPLADEATPNAAIKRTCYPIFSESQFCAACHYGNFSGVQIYGSYKEWLESPYSQRHILSANGEIVGESENYRSCQDCHMLYDKPVAGTLPSERDACSETNLEFRDFNHNMMNYGPDPDNPLREIPLLVKNAATITIDEPKIETGLVKFKVTVRNTGAGHKFPTDSPLRHLILLVQVTAQNTSLPQISGPTIPVWEAQDYAGYPGTIYANLLKDRDTNEMPSFAYWNSIEPAWQVSDTRLVPGQAVQSEYSFVAPSNGSAVIAVRLIYRKAFIEIAHQKGWPLINLDIEATKASVEITP